MPFIAGHQYLLFPPARPLAERFGAEFFRAVPEAPGVYLMSTARDGVLYVGKAKNLRRRLGSYRSGTGERLPPRLVRLLLRVERIDWDLCADEAAALAREQELIRTLQPRFNRQGVRPPKPWFLSWRRDPIDHTLHVELWSTPALSAAQRGRGWPREAGPAEVAQSAVHGPFVFASPAFAALLRRLWFETHPDTTVADLPSPLLTGPTPSRWTVPWCDAVARWLRELEQYLDVSAAPPAFLQDAIANSNRVDPGGAGTGPATAPGEPVSQPFQAQWLALDLECLVEFRERIARGSFPNIASANPSSPRPSPPEEREEQPRLHQEIQCVSLLPPAPSRHSSLTDH